MRVISGIYKGRKLSEPMDSKTRPTIDRIKESVFASLQYDFIDAMVCDLFSGSGNLGIEALSHGAKDCIFVDKEKDAFLLINENLKSLRIDSRVFNLDYITALDKFKEKRWQFDIFILDPPYESDFGLIAINKILEDKLLTGKRIIIFETNKHLNVELEAICPKVREMKYGDKYVYILKFKQS